MQFVQGHMQQTRKEVKLVRVSKNVKDKCNNDVDVSYFLSLSHIYTLHQPFFKLTTIPTTLTKPERIRTAYPPAAIAALETIVSGHERLFLDPLIDDSDPVVLASRRSLELQFKLTRCPCGSGLSASESEVEHGDGFEVYIRRAYNQNMIKDLKTKLYEVIKNVLKKSLDAEWEAINLDELIQLSIDGKAEHIANRTNRGTSNFTVVLTEQKTGKVLGIVNLNKDEENKQKSKQDGRRELWSNQLEPQGIKLVYEDLKTNRKVKKVRIVHDACNGHVSNITIAFFGEEADAHCNWHKEGSIIKFFKKLIDGKFDKSSGIEYVTKSNLLIGDIRRLLGFYNVENHTYEEWRDDFTPEECTAHWNRYVEELTLNKKLKIHFTSKSHLREYYAYNEKVMARAALKTVRGRTKKLKLTPVSPLTRTNAITGQIPVRKQWWTSYITIKYRISHHGKDFQYSDKVKSTKSKTKVFIPKNAKASDPIMLSRFIRIVNTYYPKLLSTLKTIVDQPTQRIHKEQIKFVREKWLNIVRHYSGRHEGCLVGSSCRGTHQAALPLANEEDAKCLRYLLRLHYFSDHNFFSKICFNALTSHAESFNSFVLRWVPKHLSTTWEDYDMFILFAAIVWNTRVGEKKRHYGIIDIDSPFIKHVLDMMWDSKTTRDNEKTPKKRYITANEQLSGSKVIKKMKREKTKKKGSRSNKKSVKSR
eukprot:g9953.t1